MTDTYKILGQSTSVTTNNGFPKSEAVELYKSPTSAQASISSISALNTGNSSATYKLAVVKSSDSMAVESSKKYFLTYLDSSNATKYVLSADATSWTPSTTPPADISAPTFAFGRDFFVAVGSSGGVSTSNDGGVTWTAQPSLETLSPGIFYWKVIYGAGVFVAYTYWANYTYVSTDGATWTKSSSLSSNMWDLSYGDGVFFGLIGQESDNSRYAVKSTDGLTWEELGLVAEPAVVEFDKWTTPLVVDGNFYVWDSNIGDRNAYVAKSVDGGQSWVVDLTITTGSSYVNGDYITYGNGVFVASYPTSSVKNYYTSVDGVFWIERPVVADRNMTIYFVSDMFLAVPNLGGTVTETSYVYTSTDALTWQASSQLSANIKYHLSLGGGVVETNYIEDSQTLIPTRTLASGESQEIIGGITLAPGESVVAYSDSSEVVFQVFGVEIA